jgi:hypothetical protein
MFRKPKHPKHNGIRKTALSSAGDQSQNIFLKDTALTVFITFLRSVL